MDPFASIIKFCIPAASLEAEFANCPYARESDLISGIFAPGSSTSVHRKSSAPERRYNSHLSDQNPQHSKVRVSQLGERVEVVLLDEESDGDTVPLGETEAVEMNDDADKRKGNTSRQSSAKKARVSPESKVEFDGYTAALGETEVIVIDDGEENAENILSGRKTGLKVNLKIGGSEKDDNSSKKRKDVDGEKREVAVECSRSLKRKEREVAVECSRSPKRKEREMVGESWRSLKGKGKVKKVVGGGWEKKNSGSGLIEVVMAVFGDEVCDDDDADFLLTAKKMGLKFARPRWWPPAEGDDANYWC